MRLPVASSASLEPARQRQVWIDDRPSTELGLRSRSHLFRMIFAPEAADASGANLVYGRCAKEGSGKIGNPAGGCWLSSGWVLFALIGAGRLCGRAHLARHCGIGQKSSLGALLREREVTGRDASLPAPLLSAFDKLVARGTVGALPQTPQGTLSLDPFSRLSWSLFPTSSACLSSFCPLISSSLSIPS